MIQLEVNVAGGEIVSSAVRSEIDDSGIDPWTVDDLFDEIESAIDDGAFSVAAQFDAETGHPTGYFIDVEEMMADEEFGIGNVTLVPA